MYEELEERMDDICGILIMVKAVYDATGYKIESILDGDYFFDVYMEAIESAANELEYGTVEFSKNGRILRAVQKIWQS